MKNKNMLMVMGLLLSSTAIFAGDVNKHGANIIKVSDDQETALCACGMQVKVTDATPAVEVDGEFYYVCSDGCKTKFSENSSTMKTDLDKKVLKAKIDNGMMGNVFKVKDSGELVAKCACGMDVAVNDSTVSRVYDGHTYYLCGEHCAAMFDKNANKVIKAATGKVKELKAH